MTAAVLHQIPFLSHFDAPTALPVPTSLAERDAADTKTALDCNQTRLTQTACASIPRSLCDAGDDSEASYVNRLWSTATILDATIPLIVFPDFMRPTEIQEMQSIIKGYEWNTSVLTQSATAAGVSSSRTSSSVIGSLSSRLKESKACEAVVARALLVSGLKAEEREGLDFLKYVGKQQFKRHNDASSLHTSELPEFVRPVTMFFYLTTLPSDAGGETDFADAGYKIRPVAGTAALWFNHLADGSLNPKAFHAGAPITETSAGATHTKWAFNMFFQCKPGDRAAFERMRTLPPPLRARLTKIKNEITRLS
jgi:hypothetical protein